MAYDNFGRFYDSLMGNADYEKRADYYAELIKNNGIEGNILLDLGCGTGTMSMLMADRGFDVIGTDQSVGMLMEAQRKVMESGKKILLLNQSMEELDLYGTIDSCISTLDCINHLEGHQNVKKAFQMVSLFMVSGGVFAFDVNTIYKHHSVLANNAFVFENDKVFCTWQNTLNDDDSVDINLDFFEQEDGVYYRESESFTERAYTFDDLTSWLDEAGFTVKAIYKDMTTEPASEFDERAVFLAVKR